MGKIVNFKDISNWDELFDMTFDYLTFLLEEDKISSELVIRTTHNILSNVGYGYSVDEVRKMYYEIK